MPDKKVTASELDALADDSQKSVTASDLDKISSQSPEHPTLATTPPVDIQKPSFDFYKDYLMKDAEDLTQSPHSDAIKANTDNHTNVLAKDIAENAPQGYLGNLNFAHPLSPVNQITDVHGDPATTASWWKHRQATLEQQKQADIQKQATQQVDLLNATPEEIFQNADAANRVIVDNKKKREIEDAYDQKRKQLSDAVDNTLQLQLYNRAVNKMGVSPELDKGKTAVHLGVDYFASLGNPVAQQAQAKLNAGKPLTEDENVLYGQKGTDIMRVGAANAAANGQTSLANETFEHANKTDKKIVKDNPTFFRQAKINALSDQIYKNLNPVMTSIFGNDVVTEKEINDAADQLGYKDVSDITPDDIKKSANPVQKMAQSFLTSTGGGTFDALLHVARGADKLSNMMGIPRLTNDEAINEYFAKGGAGASQTAKLLTGEEPQAAQLFTEEGLQPRNIVGEIASGVGSLGGILLPGSVVKGALAGEGLLAAEKAEEAIKVAKGISKAEHIANASVMGVQGYNSAYNNSLKVIGDEPDKEPERQAYSVINGAMQAALFSLDPKFQIAQDMLGGTKVGNEIAKQLATQGIESFDKQTLANKIAQVAKETAKHTGFQMGLAGAQKVGENVSNMIFNPQGNYKATDEVGQTAVSAGIGMLLPILHGQIMNAGAATPMNKGIAWKVASNPKEYEKQIHSLTEDGSISNGQAANALSMIDQLKGLKSTIDATTHVDGSALSDKEKQDFTWLSMQQQALQSKANRAPENSVQRKAIEGRQNEVSKQMTDLLNKMGEYAPEKQAPVEKPPMPQPEPEPTAKKLEQPQQVSEDIWDDYGKELSSRGWSKSDIKEEIEGHQELINDKYDGDTQKYIAETLKNPHLSEADRKFFEDWSKASEAQAGSIVNNQKPVQDESHKNDEWRLTRSSQETVSTGQERPTAGIQEGSQGGPEQQESGVLKTTEAKTEETEGGERPPSEPSDNEILVAAAYELNKRVENGEALPENDGTGNVVEIKLDHDDIDLALDALEKKIEKNGELTDKDFGNSRIFRSVSITTLHGLKKLFKENPKEAIKTLRSLIENGRNKPSESSKSYLDDSGTDKDKAKRVEAFLNGDVDPSTISDRDLHDAGYRFDHGKLLNPDILESRRKSAIEFDKNGKEKPSESKKYSPFEAVDLGNHEGEKKTAERQSEINATPNDQPFGETGETFENAVNRIHWDVNNAKDGQAIIAHSGIMKIVQAAAKHGWDAIDEIRKAYNNQDLAEPGEVETLNFGGKELHFIRHGESEDKNNIVRQKDTPLTEKGKQQATEIGKKLNEMGIKPEDIIHSDLTRAKQTAELAKAEMGKEKEPIVEPQKEEVHATKESSEQEQKGGEQGSEPEHPRVEPPRNEVKEPEADNRDRGVSGKKKEVKPISFTNDEKAQIAKELAELNKRHDYGVKDKGSYRETIRRQIKKLLSDNEKLSPSDKKYRENAVKLEARTQFLLSHPERKPHKRAVSIRENNDNIAFIVKHAGQIDESLRTFEMAVLERVVGGDGQGTGKFHIPSEQYLKNNPGVTTFLDHAPTQKGSEEYKAFKRLWTTDDPKAPRADTWAMEHSTLENKYGDTDVAEILGQYTTAGEARARLRELYEQALEAQGSIERIPEDIHTIHLGNGETETVDLNTDEGNDRVRELLGIPTDEELQGIPEDHPLYDYISEAHREIDNATMSENDISAINDFINAHTRPDGTLDLDAAENNIHSVQFESKEAKELVSKILPFNTPKENQERFDNLIKATKKYDKETESTERPATGEKGEIPTEATGRQESKQHIESVKESHSKVAAGLRKLAQKERDRVSKQNEGRQTEQRGAGFSTADTLDALADLVEKGHNLQLAIRKVVRELLKDNPGLDAEEVRDVIANAAHSTFTQEQKDRLNQAPPIPPAEYASQMHGAIREINDAEDPHKAFGKFIDDMPLRIKKDAKGNPVSEEESNRQLSDMADFVYQHTIGGFSAGKDTPKEENWLHNVVLKTVSTEIPSEYLSKKSREDVYGEHVVGTKKEDKLYYEPTAINQTFVQGGLEILREAQKRYSPNNPDAPVTEYADKMLKDIQAIDTNRTDMGVIQAMSTLALNHALVEAKLNAQEELRSGNVSPERVKELNKIIADATAIQKKAEKAESKMLNAASRTLNAARMRRVMRDEILADHYQDVILSREEAKMAKDVKETVENTDISDNDTPAGAVSSTTEAEAKQEAEKLANRPKLIGNDEYNRLRDAISNANQERLNMKEEFEKESKKYQDEIKRLKKKISDFKESGKQRTTENLKDEHELQAQVHQLNDLVRKHEAKIAELEKKIETFEKKKAQHDTPTKREGDTRSKAFDASEVRSRLADIKNKIGGDVKSFIEGLKKFKNPC